MKEKIEGQPDKQYFSSQRSTKSLHLLEPANGELKSAWIRAKLKSNIAPS